MTVAICRSAEDPTQPCRFCSRCTSAIRQMIQDRAGARGMACDFFAEFVRKEAYEVPTDDTPRPAA